MTTFACEQCGAASRSTACAPRRCPYCASPNFVERPAAAGQPDPRSSSRSPATRVGARRALERWLGSRTMFADSALRARQGRGPAGHLRARRTCTARRAHRLHRVRSASTTPRPRRTRRPTSRAARPRHRDAHGHAHRVPAARRAPRRLRHRRHGQRVARASTNAELERVEPFDLRQMRRYSPALVSGWIAEEFARPRRRVPAREPRARRSSRSAASCAAFMPGDSYSDLAWKTARRAGSRSIRSSSRSGCSRCATATTSRRCAS